LQDRQETWTNRTLKANQTLPLAPAGDLFRIQADLTFDERAVLTLNARGAKIVLNPKSISSGTTSAPLLQSLSHVDILIDRTSIEVFANDGQASLSKCFLPAENGLSLKATEGRVVVRHLKLTHLKSAWN
jgi:sucrose-6-phosphate hydrolase SacC (GH32 family)